MRHQVYRRKELQLDAARTAGIPVEHVRLGQPDVVALYEKKFVLVRPDGHVAWRDDRIPGNVSELLAIVTGHQRRANP
ncbi:hypothetical protein [uncultured Pigmentiphaga sp.]|uniref:aromatic-ring hydroxylase C-terminal domain-containing protein n=1 Tax=Pigmentiphaga sp. TaxID=1977564 RepID=UPI003437CC32